MLKQIILLFLMILSCSWQASLFSMHVNSPIENIDSSDEKCKKCDSIIVKFGLSNLIYACSNYNCLQSYCIKKNYKQDESKNSSEKKRDYKVTYIDKSVEKCIKCNNSIVKAGLSDLAYICSNKECRQYYFYKNK